MCLIIVKGAGVKLPTKEVIQQAYNQNLDGVGICWLDRQRSMVNIKKDFADRESFDTWFRANITKKDSCIIHFRLRTHGLNDVGNRHPFPITRNITLLRSPESSVRYAVAHNGILNGYGSEKLSDTQKFIIDILAMQKIKENLGNPTIQKLVNRYIGGSKLATLDYTGKMWLFGDFTTEKGLQYSNMYWKYEYVTGYSRSGGHKKDKNTKVNGYGYYCDACGDEDSALVLEVTKQGEDYYFCDGCHKRYKEELIAPCVNCTYVDEIYQMYNVNTIGQPEYICDGCLDEFQQPTINHGRLAIDHLDCGTNCQ